MINDNSFNIELLYIFVQVSKSKSINQSSSILMMTQPAISKKIKQLECYYGKQLFIRKSTGMEQTTAGRKLYLEAQRLIQQFEQIQTIMTENTIHIKDLSIGCLDSISSNVYSSFFIDSLSNFKHVTITNRIIDLIKPFNNGKLDAILLDSEFKNKFTEKFSEILLFEEPYYLVYSKNNTLMNKLSNRINPTDLSSLNLLMYPKYCPIHQRIIQIYHEIKNTPPKIIEIDYSESTITMVSHSDYVTILPKSLAISKVCQNNNLFLKKLDNNFTRSVSLFARNKETLHLVHDLLS
ncbi:LysR family transcriptional regulator [Leuconostoc suionicum]|uniref:LysR family transcriptional regulator n=1 Tax=Leuconostoc suionicum TaxID=1511761 RepID=UPI0021A4F99E|nr:LysR family transcriptional regulator [Leuconostoc suionicum]MCT4376039.1 LysR family transcriptional regulator [Leuconostoc suionicum]